MIFAAMATCSQAQDVTSQTTPSSGPPIVDVNAGTPIFELKSYDLGRITWYASADLPPESSVETIRSQGTRTTPTVTLRSAAPGGTGILFCFVQLPENLPAQCQGRITIGDVDGNDESYFNGKLIGHTTGWGVTPQRPRMYTIPRADLKPGINVFAIRLSGPGGRPTFGIKSRVLTFCLAPEGSTPAISPADKSTSSVPTIDPGAAMAAISAADPTISSTLIQRKRPSFSRFGEFPQNGLPAVSEVSPTRIATRKGTAFQFNISGVQSLDVARGTHEPGIDGWHVLHRVTSADATNPLVYTCRQNVLYPGAIYSIEKGTVLQLRARFPNKNGHVIPLTNDEMKALFGKVIPGLSIYGFVPAGKDSTPAIMAVSGMSVNITQSTSHVDISLARKSASGQNSKVYIFYPVGLYPVDAGEAPKSLLDIARASRPQDDPTATLQHWMRIGLNEPIAADEYFAPVQNETAVRVYQVNRYRPADGLTFDEGPLLVRPPQVDFAHQVLAYPVQGPQTSSTGVLAFSGDLHYSLPINDKPSTASLKKDQAPNPADHIYVTSYDLPVPPLQERAPVRIFGQKELETLLNQYALGDLGTTESFTAVDALYKSRTQGYQAYSYLTAEKRKQLAESSAATIGPALGGHFWNRSEEPQSGLDYWTTYFIQGPYFKPYDFEWGNGLSLYGLATYIKYTGNWELPSRHWDAVERLFSWFPVSDDWEWMRASNSAHGYGTGAGDCQNATFAACAAYTKLAKGAGRTAEYHYGLYSLSRAALLQLNRFAYNDFAASNQFKGDKSLVMGFHEGAGFLEAELEGYPWAVTSNLSGNGIQTENYDFLMKYAQDAVRNYEQIFEKGFPRWMDGKFTYDPPGLYKNNSGYITLPHIYLRARLGGDSFATLSENIEQTRTNDYLWWLAPPVLGEILTRKADGVVVLDWEKAAFLGGQVDRVEGDDSDRRQLTLRFDNRGSAENTISVWFPRRPHRFQVNGGPVPLTDSQFEGNELKLKLRRPGENIVTVVFSEK